jgi:hypothetical protein
MVEFMERYPKLKNRTSDQIGGRFGGENWNDRKLTILFLWKKWHLGQNHKIIPWRGEY